MAIKKKLLAPRYQAWVDARNEFRLSHAQIQMARELGLNPKNFGSLANHKQEQWKSPLPRFIEDLYLERFGKEGPEAVMTIEQIAQKKKQKQQKRREQKTTRDLAANKPEEVADEDPF